jgi:hypothetical protein
MHVHVRRMKTDVLMTRTRRKQRESARVHTREREFIRNDTPQRGVQRKIGGAAVGTCVCMNLCKCICAQSICMYEHIHAHSRAHTRTHTCTYICIVRVRYKCDTLGSLVLRPVLECEFCLCK